MLKVTKTVRFDAAHLLTNHQGLCKNLHGHTYTLNITVAQAPDASDDMVMDFKDLKKVCEDLILSRFDHAFIYDETSPVESEIASVLAKNGMRTVALSFRSTAENLAKYFFDILHKDMQNVESVRVWETPTSVAEYSGSTLA